VRITLGPVQAFAVREKQFPIEQIAATTKHINFGLPISQGARQPGISEQAIYR
jgi:hypothetical protein